MHLGSWRLLNLSWSIDRGPLNRIKWKTAKHDQYSWENLIRS